MTLKRIFNKIRIRIKYFLMAMGVDFYKRTEDRRILETVIFPYFIDRPEFTRILFVGCDWYTKGYNRIFRDKDYATLEIDPAKSFFGSKKHITDGIENMTRYFKEGELDLIICNGVYGYGLNEKSHIETSFAGCFRCLRPGGIFLLGWNDTEVRPFPLDELDSLKLFKPLVFPPLGQAEFPTGTFNNHTYNFFIKE